MASIESQIVRSESQNKKTTVQTRVSLKTQQGPKLLKEVVGVHLLPTVFASRSIASLW
jgi:hypothetical protein